MVSLQRSEVSFRRQGSSGLIWDDKLVSGELNKMTQKEGEEEVEFRELRPSQSVGSIGMLKRSKSNGGATGVGGVVLERNKSNGGRVYRSGKVSPAMDPPSPKVSGCGFCGVFGKPVPSSHRQRKSGNKRKA